MAIAGRPVHKPKRIGRPPQVTERTPARAIRKCVPVRQCPTPGTPGRRLSGTRSSGLPGAERSSGAASLRGTFWMGQDERDLDTLVLLEVRTATCTLSEIAGSRSAAWQHPSMSSGWGQARGLVHVMSVQKMKPNQGDGSEANIASARASAFGASSFTCCARANCLNELPPKYEAPRTSTPQDSSGSASTRWQVPSKPSTTSS
jgi:hypothetical protein